MKIEKNQVEKKGEKKTRGVVEGHKCCWCEDYQ